MEGSTTITPILQGRKLRHKEARRLVVVAGGEPQGSKLQPSSAFPCAWIASPGGGKALTVQTA